jgi:hypothetical protein
MAATAKDQPLDTPVIDIVLNWTVIERFMDFRGIKNCDHLARLCNVHRATVNRYKSGAVLPNWPNLTLLCLHLGVGPEHIITMKVKEN